ncbi:MAG: TIGR03960 family B12-binding radical SAM protein [Bacillota bacterium]
MKRHTLDHLLSKVEKPARYTGNELNMCIREPGDVEVRFAFCFPDVYEVGMSHLGMRILYHVLNMRGDTYSERVFAPWPDMEACMRENGVELFSLETFSELRAFDIVGFTLQYEMSYSNVLNMLELGNIPLRSADRGADMPLIVAGGPCAFNPEPLAPFLDVVLLGDGEESAGKLIDVYKRTRCLPKEEILLAIANEVPGAYVPAFYSVDYYDDGRIKRVAPNRGGVPPKIRKAVVRDLDAAPFPDRIIVPYMKIVHDRITLELFRGCTRGCRFCQAGYIYRPVRERELQTLQEQARASLESTGYEEISLSSLSSGDYSRLGELITNLVDAYGKQGVSIALPSLRIDSFVRGYAEDIQRVRKSGLTFAPEAGSQRLRDVINKGVTEQDLIKSVTDAFESGWNRVKLYFMIGLPTETNEDLDAIAALAERVVECYFSVDRDKRTRGLNVHVSVSTFVPKPFTPFQWEAQDSIGAIQEKQRYLQARLKRKFITFNWHDPKTSVLEACFARGDRRLGDVLERAHALGCRFDGWHEYFNYTAWMQAFERSGIDPGFYTVRRRDFDEVFPYDHLDAGVTKAYLVNENLSGHDGVVTPDCRTGCRGCGLEEICR